MLWSSGTLGRGCVFLVNLGMLHFPAFPSYFQLLRHHQLGHPSYFSSRRSKKKRALPELSQTALRMDSQLSVISIEFIPATYRTGLVADREYQRLLDHTLVTFL